MFKKKIDKKPIKNNTIQKKSVIPSGFYLGTGLFDKAYDLILGKYTYSTSSFLRSNGKKQIEPPFYICRAPINSMIDKLFNILSFGKFDEAKNKLNYDKLYHLYLVCQLEDDSRVLIEKNQDINITNNIRFENAESIQLNIDDYYSTLDEMLEKTKKIMGENKYYSYDPFKNNCQDFIYSLCEANGLFKNNPTAKQFIKQPTEEIIKNTPQYIRTMAKVGATTASYINRFLNSISRGLIGFEEGGIVL